MQHVPCGTSLGIFYGALELCEPFDEHQEQNARREPGVSFSSALSGCEGNIISSD
jgi:hypothetical protein